MTPTKPPRREFLFVSCQPGAEQALKLEIAREHPFLRFAYSRPGFVTFKSEEGLDPRFELHSVFARAYGLTLSDSKRDDERTRVKLAVEQASLIKGPLRLHVWEREDEAFGALAGAYARAADDSIRAEAPSTLFLPPGPAEEGERVFDVVLVEPDHWWFGFHEHSASHSSDPGGNPAIPLSPEAPSRAYLKLEEALSWARLRLDPADVALEIGSSPGGASFALLKRGLSVIGVDPAEMDPRVLALGEDRFVHVRRGVGDLELVDLPAPVNWVLLDMNVPPQIAFDALERILPWPRIRENLLGVMLTLKLNRWRIAAEIPDFLERLRESGFARIRATQLPSNRQEFFALGLTRKGLTR
ncbi:MAG TPA: SAM-dependent methyltransferase, partial [Bdellovibrionota bacterium]|nr:SAM-dependent methyltransferase [Bdellovibrionota bacterium]